uniref:Ketosynthase family 3 (KS3) domain-containing protein n=1 Tax=Bionectria ochroleuca TaxID=29856 RepID=A0A8H7KF07_BIOOC
MVYKHVAGIPMEQVSGSKTGVYAGSMADDYAQILARDMDVIPKYTASGVARAMLANRISWFYNLQGPSISMDSACSGSLMAFDFACQGLRNGDFNMLSAVVAGSSVVFAPDGTLSLMNMSFLSPNGRCHSFDERADGYSRGEGFGVVLLKRLRDAVSHNDKIRAVVRSTGSNQDGHTPGVTQPSGEAQAMLIKETYEKAGLSFGETRFFESHGTGTQLGDPIEADAIGSVFGPFRSPDEPLFIGALKSNVGHLGGGSGVAGVIKVVMILEKGLIPPNANFKKLNPNIDAEFLNLKGILAVLPIHSIPGGGVAWKSFAVVNSSNSLRSLRAFLSKPTSPDPKKDILFVFTGQGAQYRNMGAELLSHPLFEDIISRFDRHLSAFSCSWSVADLLRRPDTSTDVNDPEYS